MICSHCQQENDPGNTYCLACGQELTGSFCDQCGHPNEAGAQFCEECGAPLLNDQPSTASLAHSPPTPGRKFSWPWALGAGFVIILALFIIVYPGRGNPASSSGPPNPPQVAKDPTKTTTPTRSVTRTFTPSPQNLQPVSTTVTPSFTPTSTPDLGPNYPTFTAFQNSNCRYGPSSSKFDIAQTIFDGQTVEILGVGRTPFTDWWLVEIDGVECWAYSDLGEAYIGNFDVPLIIPPSIPTDTPTPPSEEHQSCPNPSIQVFPAAGYFDFVIDGITPGIALRLTIEHEQSDGTKNLIVDHFYSGDVTKAGRVEDRYILPSFQSIPGRYIARIANYNNPQDCTASAVFLPLTQPVSFYIKNNHQVDICEVYISDATENQWGSNRIAGEYIAPGDSYSFSVSQPGQYDVQILDCGGTRIDVAYDFTIDSSMQGTVLTSP